MTDPTHGQDGQGDTPDRARSGVYVVMFSNYDPAEIRAIYDNQEAADAHADALGDGWHAYYWAIGTRYDGGDHG